jgi:hypothetical protein
MKKVCFRIFVALVAVFLSAAPSTAELWNVNDPITYTLSTSVTADGWGSGGLFTVTNTNTGAVINTFCLELTEYVYNNDLVAGIASSAVNGGRGGGSPDPIGSATDWLYAQYVGGSTTYNNTAALQIAFWLLENEVTSGEASSWFAPSLLATANSYVTDALAHNTGSYGTQVLNIKNTIGTPHQSFLINTVPIPAAFWLFSSGLIGLIGIRRRFTN